MRIRECFIVILSLFVFQMTKATGLAGDVLLFDGERWDLMAKPINMDSIVYRRVMDFIPDNHCWTTANVEGYTAFWKIQDDYLCLQQLEVCVFDKASQKESTLTYNVEALQTLFSPYYVNGRIEARWLNGELRVGKGDLVRYVHSGFIRNHETEQVLQIRNGKVVNRTTYRNYKKFGLRIVDAQDEIIRKFPWERFPEYKGQRIGFNIDNFQVTEDGHFKDCNIRSIFLRSTRETIKDGNHPLALAFKETLKSIYPWEIMFINGKFMVDHTLLSMPIWEKH